MPPNDTAYVADRTAASNVLKQFYLGPIRSQLNSKTLLMHRLAKREDVVEGLEWVIPVHTGRNAGVMARGEMQTLGASGRQSYQRLRGNVVYNYGKITLSGPLLASARTQRGAFLNALEGETKGLIRDFKKDLNRQMFSDGSGRLGMVSDVGSAPTYGVREIFDYANQGNRLRGIGVGDRLFLEDVTGASTTDSVLLGNSQRVTAVDLDARTITLAGAIGSAAVGDHFVKARDTGLSAAINDSSFRGFASSAVRGHVEMMGLLGIMGSGSGTATTSLPRSANNGAAYSPLGAGKVYAATVNGGATAQDGDLQNLSAVTEALWRPNVFANGGVPRPLTTDLMQRAVDAQEINGEARATIGICSHAVRRAYVNLLQADRRYVNTKMLDGGFEAVDFNGIPLVVDVDCPEGMILFPHEPNLMIVRQSDFFFMEKDGAVFARLPDTDGYDATLCYYSDLLTDRRNAHSLVVDVAV